MFLKRLHSLETVRLGELLLKKGKISAAALENAIAHQRMQGGRLGEILISQQAITPHQLKQVLVEQKVKRWAATALLALGTTAGSAPQIVTQTPNLPSTQTAQTAIGGTNTSRNTNASSKVQRNREVMRVSLARHPKPTAKAPLVGFCHPTAGKGYLSQGNNGITHRGRMAYAYDIATPIGTPLYAMRNGTVIGVRDKYPDTGGGRSRSSKFNFLMIEHDGGYRSAYVHLQQNFNALVNLKKGDTVQAGQLIGYTGNSGWSTGPHLHVEVQRPKSAPPSGSRKFSKTVPFSVHGRCESPTLARR